MWEWIQANWPAMAGVALVLSWFIEVSKIKLNPWSAIFHWIGRKANADLYKRFDELERKHSEAAERQREINLDIKDELNLIRVEADQREAKRLRASLLSFTDACRIRQTHTQAQFENVLRDYDDYLELCEKHNIQNHYVDESIDFVRKIYQRHLKDGTFS